MQPYYKNKIKHKTSNIVLAMRWLFTTYTVMARNVTVNSRQISTPSQIFDFLVVFCRVFNADSNGNLNF
jgi:hypothetical protein